MVSQGQIFSQFFKQVCIKLNFHEKNGASGTHG